MPSFTFTSPEGQKYTVNGPDGATPVQAFAILQGYIGGRKTGAGASKSKSSGQDILPSFGSGLRRGAESLVGIPGDVGSAMDAAAAWGAGKLGIAPPKMSDIPAMARPGAGLPTTGQVHEAVSGAGVPDYEPQTTAGKYARTIGEFVPGAVLAPGEGMVKSAIKYGGERARGGFRAALSFYGPSEQGRAGRV
jgi:hypothetical protein